MGDTVVPSTSAWLPPMKMPMVPSLAGIWVVCTSWLSWEMNWSSWSCNWLSVWVPVPCVLAICAFTLAMLLASELTLVTICASGSVTPCCSWSRLVDICWMLVAVSLTLVSATVRAVRSAGVVATAENEFIMLLMTWPTSELLPWNRLSRLASWVERSWSPAAMELVSVACCPRNVLYWRSMFSTFTPSPR